MPIYTVGHSNHTPGQFFEILAPFGITHIIDIRSVPYSGRFPYFNRDNLEKMCCDHDIAYEWHGDTLGGKRDGDPTWEEIAGLGSFNDSIARLKISFHVDAGGKIACLLCAERDPERCHRSMLIGPALRKFGVDLHHINPDGTLTLQSELEASNKAPSADRAGTMSLFDENE